MGKSQLKVDVNPGFLLFKTHKGFENFKICNIKYCKATRNYTTLVMEDGESRTICKTLKVVENALRKSGFIRCHSSWVINQDKVLMFSSRKKEVYLSDLVIPISRKNFDEVCIKLLRYNISDNHISQKSQIA